MANDVVFKTRAFGGYDKTEVMDYINKLLEEKSALEKSLSEANARFAQANSQLFELKMLSEENEALKAKLEEALATIDSLKVSLDEAVQERAALESQLEEKEAETQREFENLTVTEHVNMLISGGMDKKEAIKEAAKQRGVPKREVYNEYTGDN